MSSPLIGSMFINAMVFGIEENVRKLLNLNNSNIKEAQNYKLYAISGSIAGLTQAIFLSPVELIKIKMQLPDSKDKTIWSCSKQIYIKGGYPSLMRGVQLTMARDLPGITSYFMSFEYICNSISNSRLDLTVSNFLIAGGAAGCFSWFITYPIDVIKTRFQADLSYKNVFNCIQRTFQSEGFMGFWRGLSPTLIRYTHILELTVILSFPHRHPFLYVSVPIFEVKFLKNYSIELKN